VRLQTLTRKFPTERPPDPENGSPGAIAALEASEKDQLGGKVDPENSLRILTAQPPRPRAGNATRCLVCGSAINPRRATEIVSVIHNVIDREVSGALTTSGVTFKPTEPPPASNRRRSARVCRGGNDGAVPMSKIQKQALRKQKVTTPTVQYDNPWLEAAAEAGNEFGKLLKFNKGEWLIGEDTVSEGTEYIAFIDEVARGWIKFEDGSVTDRQIVKVRDGKPLPRETLGDDDPSQWEVGDDGKPRDPYVFQWLLPMSPAEAERDLTGYATASKGGIGAIGLLCKVYGRSQRNGLLPIVALKTTSYKHPVYGKVLKPDLPIVGWHGTPSAPQAPSNSAPPWSDAIPY